MRRRGINLNLRRSIPYYMELTIEIEKRIKTKKAVYSADSLFTIPIVKTIEI